MFQVSPDLLKAREGLLEATPLPVLLHAILLEKETCVLELKAPPREKRIFFEDGSPVGCTSNLLHESLGPYLVEKGKLTEEAYRAHLAESAQLQVPFDELIVTKGILSAFELYKLLQGSLGHAILDCFRWTEAKYRLLYDLAPLSSPVRMNGLKLIITGTQSLLPFDVVATHLSFADAQRFALVPEPPHELAQLKLPTKEMRLFSSLRARPNFEELSQKTGLETEPLLRRLFALAVLGFVDFAEAVPEADATAAAPAAPEAPRPPEDAAPQEPPDADDDEALKSGLLEAFAASRTKTPFELLRVPETVQIVEVRNAFLRMAERYSPVRFRDPDLHEKAQALLLALARAFTELSNPEQLALWRRRSQERSAQPAAKVEIKTNLLDANAQVDQGKRLLQEKDAKGALALFGYAYDLDPKPATLAYRGWARYLANPAQHRKLALQELAQAADKDAKLDLAYFFIGEIHRLFHEYVDAEQAYRRAFKANPKQRKYVELIKAMIQSQKDPKWA